MDEEAVKILEIGNEAWAGGLAFHQSSPIGGLYKTATNFDPFYRQGVFIPAPDATQRGTTISATGIFLVPFVSASASGVMQANTAYFYLFADAAVHQVNTPSHEVHNVSAQVAGITTIRGAVQYKSKMLYSGETDVFANGIPLALAKHESILSVTSGGMHILKIGPDRNLYVTNRNKIGRIVSVTDPSQNSASYLTFEDDVETRDIESDGNYLVILGDTCPAGDSNDAAWGVGNHRTFVAFWNMKSQDLSRIWEFKSRGGISVKFDGDEVIVHTRNGMFTCSIDSPIRPLSDTSDESTMTYEGFNVGSVIKDDHGVFFGNGEKIFAYGSPNPDIKKILFHAATAGTASGVEARALLVVGDSLYATTSDGKLWQIGRTGTTRGTASLSTAGIVFSKPYKFAYARVVLRSPLASGQAVKLRIRAQNGNKTVLDTQSFDFTAHGAKSSHIFLPKAASSGNTLVFEDTADIDLTNIGTQIHKLEIYGYPIDSTQNLGI